MHNSMGLSSISKQKTTTTKNSSTVANCEFILDLFQRISFVVSIMSVIIHRTEAISANILILSSFIRIIKSAGMAMSPKLKQKNKGDKGNLPSTYMDEYRVNILESIRFELIRQPLCSSAMFQYEKNFSNIHLHFY